MAADNQIYIDGFSDFSGGINSGIAPILLPKNQLSFMINGTLRGNFATHRPCYRKINLDFGNDTDLQANFENGLWQFGSFFKSEYGSESLVVSIGGRLFDVVPSPTTPTSATVRDVSITGDLNSSSNPVSWLWQSERWIICNDSIKLPLFYDGQTTRRSFGESQLLELTAVDFTAPAVGGTVSVTLASNYTGPYNTTVYIDDVLYQVNSSASGYEITIKSLTAPAGQNVPNGTQVLVPLNLFGLTQNSANAQINNFLAPSIKSFVVSFDRSTTPMGGTGSIYSFHLPGTGDSYTAGGLFAAGVVPGTTYPSGKVYQFDIISPPFAVMPARTAAYQGYFQSGGTLGQLQAAFTTPVLDGTTTALLSSAYTGPLPATVVINGDVYEITATNNTPVSSNVVTVTNLTDTPGFTRGPTAANGVGQFSTVPELPIGKMGAYGMGRNWMCLADGRSFIASDLVGGSSGSPAVSYRDAVLKVTENTFLAGGGVFVVPGNIGDIKSMTFTAILDTSLGQGPLQIGTPSIMFSCYTPVDRTTWQSIENPILTESLRGAGPLGQYSTIPINSDTLFRSFLGLGSLILARREFTTWGNTPISREVDRIFVQDAIDLLSYGSAVEFENRLILTTKPVTSQAGVFHQGVMSLNFEPVSSIAGKSPAIYDGLWTGVNSLQWIKGRFSNEDRAFVFAYNINLNKIELYELLNDGEAFADNNGDEVPIKWIMETACLFKDVKGKGEFDQCKLIDGELFVADVRGRVNFRVQYRSQFDPCWHEWTEFSICAVPSENSTDNIRRQNRVELGLGRPPVDSCDPSNNRPYYVGETFQFRITITGHCKFYGILVKAAQEPKSFFAKPVCGDQDCRLVECVVEGDYDAYQLQNRITTAQQQAALEQVFNQSVSTVYECADPEDELSFTGTLPSWISFSGNTFTGSPGVYQATSQVEADSLANTALNEFIQEQQALGNLVCSNDCSVVPTQTLTSVVANCASIAFATGSNLACVVINPGAAPTFNTYDVTAAAFAAVGSTSGGAGAGSWVVGHINISGTRYWVGFSAQRQLFRRLDYDPIAFSADAAVVLGVTTNQKSIACNNTTGYAYAIGVNDICRFDVATATAGPVITSAAYSVNGQIAVDEALDRVLVLSRTSATNAGYVSVRDGALTELFQLPFTVSTAWPVGIAFSPDQNKFAVAVNDGNADGGDVVYIYENYALVATIRFGTAYWTSAITYACSATYNATTKQACFVVSRTGPTVGGMRFVCMTTNTDAGFLDTTATARVANIMHDDLNNRVTGSAFNNIQGATYP